MSLDRISLKGLRVFARHGVREHERQDGQEFIIDAVLRLDTRAALPSTMAPSRTGWCGWPAGRRCG